MKLSWWVFAALVSVQMIFLQYMVEEYMAGHHQRLWYYAGAMGFTLLCSLGAYWLFRKLEQVRES